MARRSRIAIGTIDVIDTDRHRFAHGSSSAQVRGEPSPFRDGSPRTCADEEPCANLCRSVSITSIVPMAIRDRRAIVPSAGDDDFVTVYHEEQVEVKLRLWTLRYRA